MATKVTASEPSSAPEAYDWEFRCYDDDAWYTVRLVCQDRRLTVKYLGFRDCYDSVFYPESLKSFKEISDFEKRFRTLSVQVQDHECSRLAKSILVCASHSFVEKDLRFFDAVIEEVEKKEHVAENGEEVCQCEFLIFWQHGPAAGTMAIKKIESLCIVQSTTEKSPEVISFLKILKEKAICPPWNSATDNLISTGIEVAEMESKKGGKECQASLPSYKLSSPGRNTIQQCRACVPETHPPKNLDNGDISRWYVLLISNVERELPSSKLMDFIYEHTSVVCIAMVYPTSLKEPYARGVIFLENEEDMEKLKTLLNSPKHIITSSRGRPLFLHEIFSAYKTTREALSTYVSSMVLEKSEVESTGVDTELKIVKSGTKEYNIAKELQSIHNEFISHLKGLYKRLATEEKRLLE